MAKKVKLKMVGGPKMGMMKKGGKRKRK